MNALYALGAYTVFLCIDYLVYTRACRKPTVSLDEWRANPWRKLPGGGFYQAYKFRKR